jgi:hypothetical protein
MKDKLEKVINEIIEICGDGFNHSETDYKVCSSFYSKRGNKYINGGKNNQACDCGVEDKKRKLMALLIEITNPLSHKLE